MSNVGQGPVVEFKRKPRQVTPRFLSLMDKLRDWRTRDHADNITLNRNEIIEMIEGVDVLTERAAPPTGKSDRE